jgi:predicted MFS family arabinose efflux permease
VPWFLPPVLSTPSRRRVVALVTLLSVATAAGTFLPGALSVLSRFLIEDLGISRSQLGVTFTVFNLTGALMSPVMGRLAEISSRRVMELLFVVATVSVLLAAAAPSLGWVLAASFFGGLGLGSANPVTNKLVSQRISVGSHGLAIGIKQTGPPLGLLIAGLILPPAAMLLGWRWALALIALMPLGGFVVTRLLVPAGSRAEPMAASGTPQGHRSARLAVGWLAVSGFAVAMGVGAVIAFVPLYAQEGVGLSSSAAGLLAAFLGLTGVVGRLAWGVFAARFRHTTVALLMMAAVALLATMLIWAGSGAAWLLWVGVITSGGSMMAWHAVAWIALLEVVNPAEVSRASGLVQLGNSIGFATGPPIAGALIDSTGAYDWAWGFVACVFLAAVLLIGGWHRMARERA